MQRLPDRPRQEVTVERDGWDVPHIAPHRRGPAAAQGYVWRGSPVAEGSPPPCARGQLSEILGARTLKYRSEFSPLRLPVPPRATPTLLGARSDAKLSELYAAA